MDVDVASEEVPPGVAFLCRHTPAPAADKPFRDELLSIERLEERALALAASFTVDPRPTRRARNIFPRFRDNARVLRRALARSAGDLRPVHHLLQSLRSLATSGRLGQNHERARRCS